MGETDGRAGIKAKTRQMRTENNNNKIMVQGFKNRLEFRTAIAKEVEVEAEMKLR